MKKLLIFLCAIMLICLCGCKGKEITPLTENIGFRAHISYYNESYVTDIKIDNEGVLTMQIVEPDVLKDIKFIFGDGQAKAIYKGIEYVPNQNNTQFFGVADKINSVFKSVKGVTAVEDDGVYIVEGQKDDNDFKLSFAQTGLPLNLEIDNISVFFSNTQIIA